jgi:hypothetical protein
VKSIALLLAAVFGLALAGPALAKRAPTAAEAKAIRAAMTAFINKKGSPAAKDNKVIHIWVSTVNSSYAAAETKSPTVGGAFAILHKVKGVWRVKDFGTGGFECGRDGPSKVLKELLGGCVPPQ